MMISFIVPVYNCKAFLPDCVSTIRSVGIPDYEILLIDDGSTDGSGKLCDELASQYPEIRVIHQANAGVSAARNRGIQLAQGEYILFMDADDTLLPFDDLVFQYLNAGVDVLIFGMKFCYYHKGMFVKQDTAAVESLLQGSIKDISINFSSLFYSNYFSPVWNKIIKRSILLENSISFDSRLTNYEDLAFSLILLRHCASFAAFPQAYYQYRVNYDHDNTVDRIAKIDDLMGNTDLIAEAFAAFEDTAVTAGAEKTHQIKACLLNIYFELFSVKMKTTSFHRIKRYCDDFNRDTHIQLCMKEVPLSDNQRRWYRWIQKENTCAIWLYVRYLLFRHFCARNIKRLLRRNVL